MIGLLIQIFIQLVLQAVRLATILGAIAARLLFALGKYLFGLARDARQHSHEPPPAAARDDPAVQAMPSSDDMRPRRLRPKPPR